MFKLIQKDGWIIEETTVTDCDGDMVQVTARHAETEETHIVTGVSRLQVSGVLAESLGWVELE